MPLFPSERLYPSESLYPSASPEPPPDPSALAAFLPAAGIPKLSVPFGTVPAGQRPNLYSGNWAALSTYRTALGATVTSDEANYHGKPPGMKVETSGAKNLEGADSGSVITVEVGESYPVSVWVKGNAGGELLYLFVGDLVVGNIAKAFTATTSWQQIEVDFTAAASGTTGFAVVTHGAAADTFWIDEGEVLGRQPVRFSTVEQDSAQELAQCVYAVLATPQGTRLEAPGFGLVDPSFDELPLNLGEELQAIAEWEPRASVTTAEEIEGMTERVSVGVKGGL